MRTDEPSCASDIAVFTTVVVLPSPGRPLVNRMVLGGLPAADNRTEVRTTRYASDTDDESRIVDNSVSEGSFDIEPVDPDWACGNRLVPPSDIEMAPRRL